MSTANKRFLVVIAVACVPAIAWAVIAKDASNERYWLGGTLIMVLTIWWGVPWIMRAWGENPEQKI